MRLEKKKLSGYGLGCLMLLITGLVLAACGDNSATAIPVPAATAASATTGANAASTTSTNAPAQAQPPVKVAVGFTAPDFTAKDVNGQNIQLSGYRGKAVLINFWSVF